MSRLIRRGLLGLVFLAGAASAAHAGRCTDENAVITAREAAAAQCSCTGSATHGAYVSCVAGVVKQLEGSQTNPLPKSCGGKVKKCAAKSTCGQDKANFVTCCVTTKKGAVCKLKKSGQACTAKGGSVNTTHTSCCSNSHPLTTGDNACTAGASPSGAFLD